MKLGNYPLNLEDPFNQTRNFEQYQNISIWDLGVNLTEVVVGSTNSFYYINVIA